MSIRQRWIRVASVLAIVTGIALLTAAYGVSANSKPHAQKAKKFGNFRAVYDTVDYLDPAQAYTGQSWSLMYHVFQTLVTYPHQAGKAGGRLVPGLAAKLPKISRAGKQYTFTLRKGLKYSNGKPIRATDFKYTIKRLYLSNSQGVGFYTNIVGAEKFSKTLKGDIPGVIGNNKKRTVTFRLVSPRGDFLSILALLFASPVPAGTPNTDQSTNNMPSNAGYRIINYVPNQGFTLVRNKRFKPSKWIKKPGPNKITVKLVGDASAAIDQVIRGQADYTEHAIPTDRLGTVNSKYKSRLRLYASANTYYYWMNTRSPVFKKLKARQAVNYAINRKALGTAIYGGLAQPTQNVLPPPYPSYKKLNLYPRNLAKARQLVTQAGVKGAKITVWGRSVPDNQKATELLAATLDSIGFKTTIKILPRSTYYTTIGNQSTPNRDIGWARWLEDYPHPSDWFDVLLNGNRITDQNNNNFSNANVAAINKRIEQLNRLPLTSFVNEQWAAVDKMVMQQALWAPYVNRVFSDFFGPRVKMSCYVNQPIYHFDFARICPK
ncbi:MAG: ABC transporter substrate-binding protein [Actinomycetota bacterium]|nr:ABC transporter substrate-binding protein [Actinomycetota bacterium]